MANHLPVSPALSIVIPLYNSADTIGELVGQLQRLEVPGGLELVLVNDGSRDETLEVCRKLMSDAAVPVTLVSLARNFGEHNAVLEGLRRASGKYIITMDDDGQNPPSEVLKLLDCAIETGADVVYGDYARKYHAFWRNWGSAFCNWVGDFVLDKPAGFYLSSFRCLSAFIAKQIGTYQGPFPYIDGLILQITQSIASIEVEHVSRSSGQSQYTMRKLVRLWLNMFLNFSILPLHAATGAGFLLGTVGLVSTLVVLIEYFIWSTPLGWGSIMAGLLVFSGTQLILLGMIGEYVGRTYLTVNRKPQSVVRDVEKSGAADGG